MRTALLLLLAAAAGAADARLTLAGDEVVRPGVLFHGRVRREADPARWGDGPLTLTVTIAQGEATLATTAIPLEHLGQLHDGVEVALAPVAPPPGAEDLAPTATAHLAWDGGSEDTSLAVTTPRRAVQALSAVGERLRAGGSDDPLPCLWLEQGAALATGGTSLRDLHDVAAITARLGAWLDGARTIDPGDPLRALRDPVDGWPQPYRCYRPAGEVRAVALLLIEPATAPSKSRWRPPPAGWLEAASSAGVAVIEAYPAGDVAWLGVAPRRALQALGESRLGGATVVVGVGRAAQAALRLVEDDPGRFSALALVDAAFAGEPGAEGEARWRAQRRFGGHRIEQIAGTPAFITGDAAAAAAPWLERVRAATRCERTTTRPSENGFWQALAAAGATPAPPREYVVDRPGRYGEVEVLALARWGVPGALVWDEGRRALRTAGLGAVRLPPRSEASVDGRRAKPPRDPDPRGKVLGQACGPLDGYRDGPFVLVVGAGEHAAAVEANRALQRAFLSAWIAHAQGAPPVVEDDAFDAKRWAHHHLVLIGGPRSNSLAAALIKDGLDLGARWDAREAVVDGRAFPRVDGRAIALCAPHPAHDGRLVVLLDGALPPPPPGEPPLAGLGDRYVGPIAGENAPAIDRLCDANWK